MPWVPCPPEDRVALAPVRIEQERECHFKKKADGKRGCERCGRSKGDSAHLGTGGSFNAFGSGANQFAWQGIKAHLMKIVTEKLTEAGLPKGLGHVLVEGRMTFPDRGRRDQGNFRIMWEKAVGDALKEGGWLEDDDWTRYEFGGLAYAYERGVSRTELMFFPAWPRDPEAAEADQLPLLR